MRITFPRLCIKFALEIGGICNLVLTAESELKSLSRFLAPAGKETTPPPPAALQELAAAATAAAAAAADPEAATPGGWCC